MYEQNDNVGGLQRQQFSWRITMIFPIGNICNYLLCQLLSTSINYVLLMIFFIKGWKTFYWSPPWCDQRWETYSGDTQGFEKSFSSM